MRKNSSKKRLEGSHTQTYPSSSSASNLEEERSKIKPNLKEQCERYYKNSYKFYEHFFLKCLEEIEDLQPSGFACIQTSRYFTVGVLPKYCIIPDPLSRKERDRVERILAN